MGIDIDDCPARDLSELSLLSGHSGSLRIRRNEDLRGWNQQAGPILQAPRAPDMFMGCLQGWTDRPAHRRLKEVPLQHLRYLHLQSDRLSLYRMGEDLPDLRWLRGNGCDLRGTHARHFRQPFGRSS
mmetsp:Transcript_11806/g.13561  ORF Transcript_11806/g.13561 Transcript_11806/m.13561 type:complete len:127 (+) Transcript_11806:213-593(+)